MGHRLAGGLGRAGRQVEVSLPSATLLAQSVIGGVFTGALYGLLGLGLSLSWGLLHQINLAQFGLAFASAYLTYELGTRAAISPLWALLLLPPLFFAIGAWLQWTIQRFKVTPLNSLLLSFGVTIILEAALQWIWTADFRRLESELGQGKFRVAGLFLPYPEMLTLALSLGVALAVWAMFRATDIGRAMRAAAEDGPMATAFGIDAQRLGLLLAGLTTALASLAGVCIALTYTLAPSQIYAWIGVVFACAMMGGLGRPLGPLLAGIAIGVAEALTMALTAPAWAPLVSFSLLMVVLLARPGRA